MIWLFLLGIISLDVYHKGFRKVLLWGLGVSTLAFALMETIILKA
jgi:hypothetical protein